MDRAMNTNSKDSHDKPGRQADLAARERRVCSVCGAKFSATRNSEFCPMCMLRQALPDAVESVESPFEDTVTLTERFEHYELVKDEHGNPIELGRGAMGVTYKAFDIDLHCPVTLKVINEKYLGDESARLRFLREARAARSSPECCLGLPPGQNRSELLLRDGVCRGGNSRQSDQTLSSA